MKRLFRIIGYIVIISQVININFPVMYYKIGGYALKYILYFMFIVVSLMLWLLQKIDSKNVGLIDTLLLVFIFLNLVHGLFTNYAGMDVITEASLFLMPVAVYAYAEMCDMDLLEFTDVLCGTVTFSAVLSYLVAVRIIKTDIWAPEGDLVRSAGAIDSTVFIGGFIILSVKLFIYPSKELPWRQVFYYIGWISCIVGTLFGQSRTRIVMVTFIIAAVFIYNLVVEKSNGGTVRLILLAVILSGVVFFRYYNIASQIIKQSFDRFSDITAGDINISFRQEEMKTQLEIFFTHPLFGAGWGSRSVQRDMYAHNIYTTLLMQSGILSVFYMCWLVNPIRLGIQNAKSYGIDEKNLTCIFLSAILLVLGYTNAGILQSGGYMSAVYLFICGKDFYRKAEKYENRNIYLPSGN